MKPNRRPQADSNHETILITGISGAIGRALTRRLTDGHRVVGIDRRPFHGKPRSVEVHIADLRKRRAEDLFRTGNIRAVVHLGQVRDPRINDSRRNEINVGMTHAVFSYVQRYQIPKIVLLSTANAYGALPDNPVSITEDAPLNGARAFPEIRDQITLDMYAQSFFWKHPEIETVILRPVHILGPTVRNAASNYLRLPTAPVVMGYDPMLQVIHEDDVIHAILLALRPGIKGIFNIVGSGELPLRAILRILGRRIVPLPHALLKAMTLLPLEFAKPVMLPDEWDFIRYSCTVDGSQAKAVLGFEPHYSLIGTITSILCS